MTEFIEHIIIEERGGVNEMVETEKVVTSPATETPMETKTAVTDSSPALDGRLSADRQDVRQDGSAPNEEFWERMKTVLEDTFKPLSETSVSRAPDVIVPVPPELVEEKEIKKVKKQKNLWDWLL